MITAWSLLLASRKFWVGSLTLLSVAGAILLVALGKLDPTQLTVTITAVSAVGITLISSVAWEDTVKLHVKSHAESSVRASKMIDTVAQVIKSSLPPPPVSTKEADDDTKP